MTRASNTGQTNRSQLFGVYRARINVRPSVAMVEHILWEVSLEISTRSGCSLCFPATMTVYSLFWKKGGAFFFSPLFFPLKLHTVWLGWMSFGIQTGPGCENWLFSASTAGLAEQKLRAREETASNRRESCTITSQRAVSHSAIIAQCTKKSKSKSNIF